MRGRLGRHIVLVGMMGAGKSALGSELARRLHVPLGQLDALVNGLLPEVPALLDLRLAALLATSEPSPALRLRRAQPAA